MFIGFVLWPRHTAWDHTALWVTAAATALTTAVLLVTAILALRSLQDASDTRHGQVALDLSKRRDSDELLESLKLFTQYQAGGVSDLLIRLYGPGAGPRDAKDVQSDLDLYYKLIRWPNLIDMIGVLWQQKVIRSEFVFAMWGPSIISAWTLWQAPTEQLRELERRRSADAAADVSTTTFRAFQDLAAEMRRLGRGN